MESNKFIFTVTGSDRPGIIALISKALKELDCNIENVSQVVFDNIFASIFLIAGQSNLTKSYLLDFLSEKISPFDLEVFAKKIENKIEKKEPAESEPFIITIQSPDKKKILVDITAFIAKYNINIRSLSGVFQDQDKENENIAILEVDVPKDISLIKLKKEMNDVADRQCLKVNMQHKDIFSAINRI
ncbi:MAG: hypothetical protein H8E17_06170 [Deltaproteobacteria bacterium]|nr:hypothetical protein [Deltaproteobacteria bacterium]